MSVAALRDEALALASLRKAVHALASEIGPGESRAPTAVTWETISNPPATVALGMTWAESRTAFVRSRLSAGSFALVVKVTRYFGRTPGELGAALADLQDAERRLFGRFKDGFLDCCRGALSEVAKTRRAGAAGMRAGFRDIGELGVELAFKQSLSIYLTLKTDLPLMIVAGLDAALAASPAARMSVPATQMAHAPPVRVLLPQGATVPDPAQSLRTTEGFINAQARAAARAYLGVKTDVAGRLKLMRDWPILAFVGREFEAQAVIDFLFTPGIGNLAMFTRLIDGIEESNRAFEKELKALNDKTWARYSPLIIQLGRWIEDLGFPGPLVDRTIREILGADTAFKPRNFVASTLTVAAIICGVFAGPMVALGAGLVSGLASVGVSLADLLEQSAESKTRAALAYGHPDAEALAEVLERPGRLDNAETAVLIEMIFLTVSAAPIIKSIRSPAHLAPDPSINTFVASKAKALEERAAEEGARIDRHLGLRDQGVDPLKRGIPGKVDSRIDGAIQKETIADGKLKAAATREQSVAREQEAHFKEMRTAIKEVAPSPSTYVKEGSRIRAIEERIRNIEAGRTKIPADKRQAEILRLREVRDGAEDVRRTYQAARGATTAPTKAIDRFTTEAARDLEKIAALEKKVAVARNELAQAKTAYEKARKELDDLRAGLARVEEFAGEAAARNLKTAQLLETAIKKEAELQREQSRLRSSLQSLGRRIEKFASEGGRLDALRDETLKRLLLQRLAGADPLVEVKLLRDGGFDANP